MSRYVVDAWAWVEYLKGSKPGLAVKELLADESSEVFTCAITLAEVISKVARESWDVKAAYSLLSSNSQIVSINEDLSVEAGLTHFEMRKTLKDFGLADAYVLATARKLGSKVLTGDAHFKNVKEAIVLKIN